MNWQEANKLIEELNKKSYCGYLDWRLPEVNELYSLTDYIRSSPVMLQGHPFFNVKDRYWSSITYAYNKDYAWIVLMYDGLVSNRNKVSDFYVWLIRSGQCMTVDSSTRFVDNNDGTVSDTKTGLMWTKDANIRL